MSPIKFEENIKEELESRIIPVSGAAWENLEKRLESSQKPKRKSFWWIGIAASILIAGWVTFEVKSVPKMNSPKVVIEPEVKEIIPTEVDENENTEQIIVLTDEELINKKGQSRDIDYRKIEIYESMPILIKVNSRPQKVIKISTFEDQKVKEIIAHVLETTKQKSEVTDAEIEELIVQAQKEIYFQKLFSENTKTVSADDLLYEVEFEIDKSFRDKVFKELKNQFKSMKNAVAQRNN